MEDPKPKSNLRETWARLMNGLGLPMLCGTASLQCQLKTKQSTYMHHQWLLIQYNKCKQTWLDTPTMFCSHPQSAPLPMKLLPKQRALMELVRSRAGIGTPFAEVLEKIAGAWRGDVTERPVGINMRENGAWDVHWHVPYRTRVPAKRAWFPADKTEVRITVFMKEAATSDSTKSKRLLIPKRLDYPLEPACWNTSVNGDVVVVLFERSG